MSGRAHLAALQRQASPLSWDALGWRGGVACSRWARRGQHCRQTILRHPTARADGWLRFGLDTAQPGPLRTATALGSLCSASASLHDAVDQPALARAPKHAAPDFTACGANGMPDVMTHRWPMAARPDLVVARRSGGQTQRLCLLRDWRPGWRRYEPLADIRLRSYLALTLPRRRPCRSAGHTR